MSKRFDNKRILYILGVLIILLAITILVKLPREKASMREDLVNIDTAKVSLIIISPRTKDGTPFEFARTNGRWTIKQDNLVTQPEKDAVKNILSEVMNIKPKSLEAVDKSKWNDFNLTDSLAIRVQFLDVKGKPLADLMIGRFTYSQVNNQYAAPGGSGIQGTSFVRLHDDSKVYGVDGFLALSFSGQFNDYRDKSFLKVTREDITKISFIFPADSGFVLNRKDSVWNANNQVTDSTAIANFMNGLRYINGQEIKDNYKPAQNPDYDMRIEGNNLLKITIKCFKTDIEDNYLLNSSLNPDVYFISKKDGIFDKVFRNEKYFTTKAVKKSPE